MDDDKKSETYSDFHDCVNMAPKDLEDWLDTDNSRSVGDSDFGESTGHAMGGNIVDIKRTKKDDLTDTQYDQMRKVVGYVHRHLSQRPEGDVEDTNWRYSLMNWGYDPCKDN